MGYIGSVLLLVLNLVMVEKPDWFGIPDSDAAVRITFLTVALWWAGFAQFAFRVLPDNPFGRKPTGDLLLNGYRELRKVWRELQSTKRLNGYLMAFFVFNMGIQTIMYLAVTYAKEEVNDIDANGAVVAISDQSLIVSILLIQLVAIAGAFLFVALSKRFGNLAALTVGCVAWIILCVAAYRIEWAWQFYALACGVGLVMGGSQSLSRSTYAKFLPDTIDHASYFSFYDVSYYVGTVLGTFAYGLVYQLTGDLRNTVVIIGSFFVVALVLLFLVPREEVVMAKAEA
jgi:UMF1 family MFS transporter